MTVAESEIAPIEGEFQRRFGEQLSALFRNPAKHALKIREILIEIISYIGNGIRLPRKGIRFDIEHDVLIHLLQIIQAQTIDPDDNPAAYFRTCINREFIHRIDFYAIINADPTDSTTAPPRHDPIEYARAQKEQPNYYIEFLPPRVLAMQAIDSLISEHLRNSRAEDYDIKNGCQSSIFALQRLRMMLSREYFPCVIGSQKFSPTNYITIPYISQRG